MCNTTENLLFSPEYQRSLKDKFYYVDADPDYKKRLFFENSGGSLRLKKAVETKANIEKFPDCPERIHQRALHLKAYVEEGTKDIMETIFGAKSGALVSELSASQAFFNACGVIMENITWGTNAVTSSLEHPSAFDGLEYYCKKTNREFRVAPANPATGGIEPDQVLELVDKNTCVLSIMAASNISGNIMNIKEIFRRAREINPEIYLISDAVQHAPHSALDVEDTDIDVMNFAPYKFFGVRGCGYAYVSDRVATMRHHKLFGKPENEWSLGTPTPANFAATIEIINYVCKIGAHFIDSENRRKLYVEGMKRIHNHEQALLYHMLEGTKDIPGLRHLSGVTVYVDMEDLSEKDLIVAMRIKGMDYTMTVQEYQKRGVTVYERVKASIYSNRIVSALGIDGAIRVSPLHCHGIDDIDAFLKITKEMAEEFSR